MNIQKRAMTLLLTAAMVVSMAGSVFAATKSPSKAPTTTKPANKGYVAATKIDNNKQDHSNKNDNCIVRSVVPYKATNSAKIIAVTHKAGQKPKSFVSLSVARNAMNKKTMVTQIGDGKRGVFDSAKGRCVTSATIGSKAKVTVHAKAFKGSKISILRLKSKVVFQKNAFAGTKQKAARIYVIGDKKKASDYTFAKGSFSGLNKKARFTVAKGSMTKAEFNKLKKKLVAAGFPGAIVYK